MVSQGTWSNGSSSMEQRNVEALMSGFEWCNCESKEVVIDGIDWEEFLGRSYSKCRNELNGCGYFRWGCEPLGDRTEYSLSRVHDEKLAAEATKDQAQNEFVVAKNENMKLKVVIKELDCKVNMYERVFIGLSMIGLTFGVMM